MTNNSDITNPKNAAKPMLGAKTYDRLRLAVQLLLPAFGTFYLAMGTVWGAPQADEVVATTVALATFVGVVLKISDISYVASGSKYGGDIVIQAHEEGPTTMELQMNSDITDIYGMDEITFKIKKPDLG